MAVEGEGQGNMSKGTKKTRIWRIASGWAECRLCDVSVTDCGGFECHVEC